MFTRKKGLIILIIFIMLFAVIFIPVYSEYIGNQNYNGNTSMDVSHPSNTGNVYNERIVNSTKNKNPSDNNISKVSSNEITAYPYNNPHWKNYNITINRNLTEINGNSHFLIDNFDLFKNTSDMGFIKVASSKDLNIKRDNKTLRNQFYYVNSNVSVVNVKYRTNSTKTYELHNDNVMYGLFRNQEIKYGFCINGSDDFENISKDTFSRYTYKLYGGTYTRSSDLKKYYYGDCWAFSEYLYDSLVDKGYTVRVLQYSTSFSQVHRSVQIMLSNGSWINFPYREYGWGNYYDRELNDDVNVSSNNTTIIMSNENGTDVKYIEEDTADDTDADDSSDDYEYDKKNNYKYSSNNYYSSRKHSSYNSRNYS